MTNSTHTPHTNLYTDAGGKLRERRFRLRVVAGPDKGRELSLEGGTAIVGTHRNADIVLTDDTVSRYHLELQVRRDGIRVTDLETTNGTSLQGSKIGTITVAGSSRLRIGKRTEIEIVPESQTVPLGEYQGTQFGRAIGQSQPMRRLFALLERVAPTDSTVLLEGETGTGKEALAEAVHLASDRAKGPYVIVDCASIPRELIGSELFGHVRGAYTGAVADKEGLIMAAQGGTLFLDEIGELELELQPQLLRVLETREVRRIGDQQTRRVDIRVVAATNRSLAKMVDEGRFREDLYYRLAVVKAAVPPLRERRDDIASLARHFAEALGHAPMALSAELEAELMAHDWPGNVRELRNVVERALSLGHAGLDHESSAGSSQASPQAYGDAAPGGAMPDHQAVLDLPFKEAKNQLIESFEREYLTELLRRHKGNISRAAAEAGIDRNYIHRLVKKYDISVDRG
jgi:two-component system, NtrC family, response regulator GlrR